MSVRRVAHEVVRLEVPVAAPWAEFRARYERAVPELAGEELARLVTAGASWDEVRASAEATAPHGFLRYWGTDVGPLMSLAAPARPCVEYLMGNHTIAQRMFVHRPGVMLYAPLRTSIYEDAAGETWFTVDQPSTRFAGFGDPAVAAVGRELDEKLAALLAHLGAPLI
ncbi:DUF302 domain-containing protein [Amycolatopsis rhabdoformis]|uniref:DUF302 domain-containing protein n=1 Tax=Amycolatopsis rhabdoformis TaxID=1448059 RepID=A0ABZ1II98_9PSEU|nr:DUF302 domain-containing protein [Amycolatopsis rhabdoformis]WSE33443.1 DUF302 domain-containing protein [Amycolatopsis rhabdoformis]